MRFVNISFPVYVQDGVRHTPQEVSVRMCVDDEARPADIAARLGEAIERVCNTVDLGDEE